MNRNAVDIAFVCRLGDLRTLDRLIRKYAIKHYTLLKILFIIAMDVNAFLCFYGYYIKRTVWHNPAADTVSELLIGIFLLTLPLFCKITSSAVRKGRINKRFRHNKYRSLTAMLHADDSGLCFCTFSHAVTYRWEDVRCIVESDRGFAFLCGMDKRFVPARYIDAIKLSQLRFLISRNACGKVVFVSEMKAAHQPEECARYIMHPLRGQPVYSAKTSPINFSRYFKTLFFPVWRIYSELPMILAYSLFFLFIITIFSAESIVAGVLLFLLASAILCGIITVVCYINIIIRYECDSMRKSSLNIDFYRDLVYIVSRGQRVIMDYDSIVVMREGADSVTVINNETGFVLTLSDTEQLEKIKDFLSLKTMMR